MNATKKAEEWLSMKRYGNIGYFAETETIIRDLLAEIATLKTRLQGRTYYHSDAEVEADARVMAEAVLEAHTGTGIKVANVREVAAVIDGEMGNWMEYYCDCLSCQTARKYKGE